MSGWRECGPIFSPRDFVEYMLRRVGLGREELDLGEVAVITPISAMARRICEHFGARRAERWLYRQGPALYNFEVEGVTVSALPIPPGAPSLAYFEELIALGVKHAVFTGSAGGLGADVRVGDYVVPCGAVCEDGLSQHYVPLGVPVEADGELVEAMRRACEDAGARAHVGRVWSIAAPYRELRWKAEEYHRRWGCLAVEMEVGAFYTLAAYWSVRAVALLAISDLVYPRHSFDFHTEEYARSVERVPEVLERYLARALRSTSSAS